MRQRLASRSCSTSLVAEMRTRRASSSSECDSFSGSSFVWIFFFFSFFLWFDFDSFSLLVIFLNMFSQSFQVIVQVKISRPFLFWFWILSLNASIVRYNLAFSDIFNDVPGDLISKLPGSQKMSLALSTLGSWLACRRCFAPHGHNLICRSFKWACSPCSKPSFSCYQVC